MSWSCVTLTSLHSSAHGDSATRGGFTFTDGAGVAAEVRQGACVERRLALAARLHPRRPGRLEARVQPGEEGLRGFVDQVGDSGVVRQRNAGGDRGRLQDGRHGGLQRMLRCSATLRPERLFDN